MDHARTRADRIVELSTELAVPSPIYLGHGVEDLFWEHLQAHTHDRLFLFVDQAVHERYGSGFHERLLAAGARVDLIVVPPGESVKTFHQLECVCEDLIARGVSKRSILLGFGGGSVGNLVGLAAGLIYRGVRFVEIPTTMTGQTDSTLSNKQAVNGRSGKNHFGLYHAPIFIWSDTRYLATEPLWSRRSGLVEFVKNGFISDPTILDYIAAHLHDGLERPGTDPHDLVARVIASKLPILRRDPSEKKAGIILEYGHTFGHAIEWTVMKHGEAMGHGEAVAIGMKLAAELGRELGLITPAVRDLHYDMLETKIGVTATLPGYLDADTLLSAMQNDNKKTGRELRFVLLDGIGKCKNPEGDYLVTVDPRVVRRVIDRFASTPAARRATRPAEVMVTT